MKKTAFTRPIQKPSTAPKPQKAPVEKPAEPVRSARIERLLKARATPTPVLKKPVKKPAPQPPAPKTQPKPEPKPKPKPQTALISKRPALQRRFAPVKKPAQPEPADLFQNPPEEVPPPESAPLPPTPPRNLENSPAGRLLGKIERTTLQVAAKQSEILTKLQNQPTHPSQGGQVYQTPPGKAKGQQQRTPPSGILSSVGTTGVKDFSRRSTDAKNVAYGVRFLVHSNVEEIVSWGNFAEYNEACMSGRLGDLKRGGDLEIFLTPGVRDVVESLPVREEIVLADSGRVIKIRDGTKLTPASA